MMCRELGWTTELGEAFIADQAGVLDAVQRLRRQAKDVGNLQSSPQMTVDTQQQDGKEVIVLEPPASTNTVYVPQYDPVAVYAPAPATTEVAPAAAHLPPRRPRRPRRRAATARARWSRRACSSFGAGMLVNELFDDDDDHHNNNDYYYPNYGYGGMPYYPPYPYRPRTATATTRATGIGRPPGYGGGFHNSGNIIVTNPGGGGGNGYWDRYDNNRAGAVDRNDRYKSPISSAKPESTRAERPEQAPAATDARGRAAPEQGRRAQAVQGQPELRRREGRRVQGRCEGRSGHGGCESPGCATRRRRCRAPTRARRPAAARSPNSGYKGAAKDMAKPASRPAQAPAANRPNTGNVKPRRQAAVIAAMRSRRRSRRRSRQPADAEARRRSRSRSRRRCRRTAAARPAVASRQSKPSAMSGSGGGGKAEQGCEPARQAEHAAGCPQQGRWRWRWRWRQEGQALGEAHEHHQDAIFRPALLRGSRVRRCARRMRQGRGSQLVQDAGSSGRRVGRRAAEGRRARAAEAARPGSGGPAVVGRPVQDKADREDFVARYQQKHSLAAGWRRCDDAHRRRQRLADADPDREEGRQVAARRRGRRRRDHLSARRRERARRDRASASGSSTRRTSTRPKVATAIRPASTRSS